MDVAVSLMLQDLCVMEVENEVASCKAIFVGALCWFPTPSPPDFPCKPKRLQHEGVGRDPL